MLAVLAVMKAGDSVVVPWKSYGGTVQQWKSFFPRIGITGRFVDSLDPAEFEKQIDDTSKSNRSSAECSTDAAPFSAKAIFVESLANPILELVDIPAFAELAKKYKIPLIVDVSCSLDPSRRACADPLRRPQNTFGCGGYLIKPIELGANIVVESATKWISGHGTVLGGVVVDGGNFDWAGSGKFPEFTEPLPGYHGMVLSRDCGPMAVSFSNSSGRRGRFGELFFRSSLKLTQSLRPPSSPSRCAWRPSERAVSLRRELERAQRHSRLRPLTVLFLRSLLFPQGCTLSPFNAFQIIQGLETLSLRVDKSTSNALALAQYLDKHPNVAWVSRESSQSSLSSLIRFLRPLVHSLIPFYRSQPPLSPFL